MNHKLLILTCIALMLTLTGCRSGGSSSSGSSTTIAGLPGGDGGSLFGGSSGNGGSDGGGIFGRTPEPATALLLGGGLVAYAFLQRKKK